MPNDNTKPDLPEFAREGTTQTNGVASGRVMTQKPFSMPSEAQDAKKRASYSEWSAGSVEQTAKSVEEAGQFLTAVASQVAGDPLYHAHSCATAAMVLRNLQARIVDLAAQVEHFDVTEPRDVRQDALLAMSVLDRFADGDSPFTQDDAAHMVGTIRRLLAAHDRHSDLRIAAEEAMLGNATARDGQKRDKEAAERAFEVQQRRAQDLDRLLTRSTLREAGLNDKVSALTAERNDLATRLDNLAASAANDATQAAIALSDMTAERDAAAENARRARDRRGTYSDTALTNAALGVRQAIREAGVTRLGTMLGESKHRGIAKRALAAAGFISESLEKPVVRVVTSPRFYSEEDRERAAWALVRFGCVNQYELVDAVAEALGMRRAAQ